MAMYLVSINERQLRVQVRAADNGTYVRVDDGPESRVVLSALHGALHGLTLGETHAELMAARHQGGQVQVTLGGIQYAAEVVDEAHARLTSVAGGRAAAHARVELKAPMPGLLVRLLCGVGDEVQPGQPLAVLQAMKMENELSLQRGGKVTAVNAAEGQTLEQGQVLVVLE